MKFLAFTGLRRGEALNLKWTDIDASSGMIHVRTSKNGRSRTVPLEAGARAALSFLSSQKFEYVFCTEDGSRFHRTSFLKPLKKAVKRAGIAKRIDIHAMRHSYGSNKIRQGWGLKKVSLLLGHSDIQTTSSIYTHLLDGDLRVQDEVRFDKGFEKENSKAVLNTKEGPSSVTQALSTLIVSFHSIPSEQITAESVRLLLEEAYRKANGRSGNEQSAAQEPSENAQNVTPLLRAEESFANGFSQQFVDFSDFTLDFNNLSSDCTHYPRAVVEELN